MLERTAGCVEHAGRRFLRDPNGSIRSRTALYAGFGQATSVVSESSSRLLDSRQVLRWRKSTAVADASTERASSESRTPFLEFLYPGRTQEFAASCLQCSSRTVSSRRKRRGGNVFSRTFSSNASPSQIVEVHQSQDATGTETRNPETQHFNLAKDRLIELLGQGILAQHTDRAWRLFQVAGKPGDLTSSLLAQLTSLENGDELTRIQTLFRWIHPASRSAQDFFQMAKFYIAVGQLKSARNILKKAEAAGHGFLCWGRALTDSLNKGRWDAVDFLWSERPGKHGFLEDKQWKSLAPYLSAPSVQKSLVDLSLLVRGEEDDARPGKNLDRAFRDFCRFFLKKVFQSPELIEDIPTNTLLLLLQRFHLATVLTYTHFFSLLATLQSSKDRAKFARSIVIYRNFRWLMDKVAPPARLLDTFIKQLASFHITAGIEYFLDEFSHFDMKPTKLAYEKALVAFARTGDASSVERLFGQFVAHHGKPQSRRYVTPLLYVHASVGNVEDTLAQFNRVAEEFEYGQNQVCWNILLTAYANAGDLAGCFSRFKVMLEKGVEPNSHTIGILMGLFANRGDIDTVFQVLDYAKEHRVQLTTPMLDPVVEAHCRNHNLASAERFAESCLDLEVKGSRVRMWNILLWNYALKMDLDSISHIRSRMDAAKIQPDGMTYAALMLSLVLLRQTESARRILRTLHRSRKIHATEFHYAIILLGYLRDRNRDMVHIILREMQARFGSLGLGSWLLGLKSELQRDLTLLDESWDGAGAEVRLAHAEKFLAEAIKEFDLSRLATKQPVHGASKQPLAQAYPALFYESVIREYGKRGAVQKAEKLFDEYADKKGLVNKYEEAPHRLLSALMIAQLRADQYGELEKCWNIAFRRARELARPTEHDELFPSHLTSSDLNAPLPQRPILIEQEPEKPGFAVLPAYRFMLSQPLSLYMRSLAYQGKMESIDEVLGAVQAAGFTLTSTNWSTYVKLLVSSDNVEDRVKAFTIVEEKFMPNFPGWSNLRRGYGVKHSDVPPGIDLMEPNRKPSDMLGKEGRRHWNNIHKDFIHPTYILFVYLAAALRQARARSITEGESELQAFHTAAPDTVATLAKMPFLRERFQGVLLGGVQENRARDAVSEKDHPVWTGGILGVGGRRRRPQPRDTLDLLDEESLMEDEETSLELSQPESETAWFRQPPTESTNANVDSPQPKPTSVTPSSSGADTRNAVHGEDDESHWLTVDHQDRYDLEVEAALSERRRVQGTDEELMDNDEPMEALDHGELMDDSIAKALEELEKPKNQQIPVEEEPASNADEHEQDDLGR
ncbi:hypothetical protein BJX61DRAFT_94571 [Aspergillus egyptiacus]|nr:hypothetical protein BJX61DRAFT_94571 [Aspergillus egyptiacus]